MNTLQQLQAWYAQTSGVLREHRCGIKIDTYDNPGWWVKIDLVGTALEHKTFPPIIENVNSQGFPSEPRWIHCQVINDVWEGAGDETRLEQILNIFLAWADMPPASS